MEFEQPNNQYDPKDESEGGGVKTQRAQPRAETKPVQDFSIPVPKSDPKLEATIPPDDEDPSNAITQQQANRSRIKTEALASEARTQQLPRSEQSKTTSEQKTNYEVNQKLAPMLAAIENAAVNAVYSAANEQGVDISAIEVVDHGIVIEHQEVASDLEEALNDLYVSTKKEQQREASPKSAEQVGVADIVDPQYLQNHLITGRLGGGGGGEVFRVDHIELQREEAVKIFRKEEGVKENSQNQEQATIAISDLERRFRTEMTTMASIRHKHVLDIYTGGVNEHGAYFSMQAADGGSLVDFIEKNGSLDLFGGEGQPGLVDYAIQIAEGIIAIHQSGIVHRDLKPDNILMHQGQIKIADFGLISKAKEAYSPQYPDKAEDVLTPRERDYITGTPHYIAPETYKGHGLSYKSDAFAFGVTLFELATGEMLFSGSYKKLQFDIMKGRIDPEKIAWLDDYGPEFKKIVVDLLIPNPKRRLNMYAALQRLQALRGDAAVEEAAPVTGWNEDLSLEEQQAAGKALVKENAEIEKVSKQMQKELRRREILKKMEEAEQRNLDRRDPNRVRIREQKARLAQRSDEEKRAARIQAADDLNTLRTERAARIQKEIEEKVKEAEALKRSNETNSQRRKREEQEAQLAATQQYEEALKVRGALPPPLIQADLPKPKKKQNVFKRAWGGIKNLFGRR